MNNLHLPQSGDSVQWVSDLYEDLGIILENYFDLASGEEVTITMLEFILTVIKASNSNDEALRIISIAFERSVKFMNEVEEQ